MAKAFFDAVAASLPILDRYMSQKGFARIAAQHRSAEGGHLLFRPAGLRAFAEAVSVLIEKESLGEAETKSVTPLAAKRRAGVAIRDAVARVATLPMRLDVDPYNGLLWNRGHVAAGKRSITRDLMLDMLGEYPRREALRERYAKALDREGVRVRLPSEKMAARSGSS